LDEFVARLVADDLAHHISERLVIIDEQHALVAAGLGRPRGLAGIAERDRDAKREDGTLANDTFDAQVAAEQPGQGARQRQAEAGAFDLLLQPRLDLGELFENPLLIRWRDADSGVADRKADRAGVGIAAR